MEDSERKLKQLFAESYRELPAEDFTSATMHIVQRRSTTSFALKIVMGALGLAALIVAAPFFAVIADDVGNTTAALTATLGRWITPWRTHDASLANLDSAQLLRGGIGFLIALSAAVAVLSRSGLVGRRSLRRLMRWIERTC
jgi:hypothetical protein